MPISSLNILDIIILVIAALSIIFGIIKGFIREVLSLAFFAIAVVLSLLFYSQAGNIVMEFVENRNIANFVGFISIFTIVLIAGSIITYVVKKMLTVGPLQSVDRIMGGVFGLLRGVAISGIIVFGLIAFPVNDKLLKSSRLAPYVVDSITVLMKMLPKEWREKYNFVETKDLEKKDLEKKDLEKKRK